MHYPCRDTEDAPESQEGERRSATRLAFEGEVSVAGDSQFFTGRAINLSVRGVFVATDRQLALDSPVVLQIVSANGEVFAKGHVRWIRDALSRRGERGLGIEFEAPLPEPYAQRFGL
ncbi:MAG TPA: PilZ domain-containing protein [Polyangiaceae bacterium]